MVVIMEVVGQLGKQRDNYLIIGGLKIKVVNGLVAQQVKHAGCVGSEITKIELSQPANYQYFRMIINEINGTDKVHLNF